MTTLPSVPVRGRDSSQWPHTGAVLAGGLSLRMGRAKHIIVLPDGRTMLETMIETLAVVCSKVVVLGSRDLLAQSTRAIVIEDLRPQSGPLGGIEALLSSGLDSRYLVCACDVPRIGDGLLRLLTDAPANVRAVVPHLVGRDHAEPLPARLSVAALPEVTRLLDEGRRAVWQLMRELEAMEVAIPTEWSNQLININTPEDLSELQDQ